MKLFMMLLAVLFTLGCLGAGFAQDQSVPVSNDGLTIGEILSNAPAVKTGVFFNINDSKFQYINSASIVEFKGFSLDLGYADQEILCGSVNYDLIKLEKLGVTIPILKDIAANIGWTAGWKRVFQDSEFCTGPEATLKFKVKF